MEATSDISYGLPIMVTLMVAKWIGDWFNRGIYDTHILLKSIPILEWEGPRVMRKFTARAIMNSPVITFKKVENVWKIYQTLLHTTHNGFPITLEDGKIIGLILRDQLITLLKCKAFQRTRASGAKYYPQVKLESFIKDYPRGPSIQSIVIHESDKPKYMDLSLYMNLTPYLIQQHATLVRVFRIFRTMGLRHLPVIDTGARVVGMITRKDLANCEERIKLTNMMVDVRKDVGGEGYENEEGGAVREEAEENGDLEEWQGMEKEVINFGGELIENDKKVPKKQKSRKE